MTSRVMSILCWKSTFASFNAESICKCCTVHSRQYSTLMATPFLQLKLELKESAEYATLYFYLFLEKSGHTKKDIKNITLWACVLRPLKHHQQGHKLVMFAGNGSASLPVLDIKNSWQHIICANHGFKLGFRSWLALGRLSASRIQFERVTHTPSHPLHSVP